MVTVIDDEVYDIVLIYKLSLLEVPLSEYVEFGHEKSTRRHVVAIVTLLAVESDADPYSITKMPYDVFNDIVDGTEYVYVVFCACLFDAIVIFINGELLELTLDCII